jgi:hypothetical protein
MCNKEQGEVPKHDVLRVLSLWKVDVSPDTENESEEWFVCAKGDVVRPIRLPDCVERNTLFYLESKFGVYIHHFYHPEMIVQMPPSDTPN